VLQLRVMHGKAPQGLVWQSPAAATFGYAQVETALAQIYEAADVQRTTFRARLKHFRKLGLPQRHPGKGSRLRYTASDIFQLLIACELAEFGIDPHLITDIVRRHWRMKLGLFQAIDLAQRFPGDDRLVAIEAHFMSWDWNREKSKRTATEISTSVQGKPVTIHFPKISDSEALFDELQKTGRRYFVFNLSARVRAVEKALVQPKMK
jgi:hypothetical protein